MKVIPRNYLNTNDIETDTETIIAVIETADGNYDCVEKRVMQDGAERFVLATEFGNIVLNVVNIENLSSGFKTNESTEWIGKTIILKKETTTYKGKDVECLRVYPVIQEKLSKNKD